MQKAAPGHPTHDAAGLVRRTKSTGEYPDLLISGARPGSDCPFAPGTFASARLTWYFGSHVRNRMHYPGEISPFLHMIYGLRFALVLLGMAVIAGAFGAHQIRDHVSPERMHAFETGVLYHFFHAFGIIAVSLVIQAGWMDPQRGRWIIRLFSAGVLLFSGSLYLLSTTEITGWVGLGALGPVTPLGGLCFIAAWLLAAFSVKLPVLRD